MRVILGAALASLVLCAIAAAQTSPPDKSTASEVATPPPAELPPAAPLHLSHVAPPADMAIPELTADAVRAARGNGAHWHDTTRYHPSNHAHGVPDFGGYFAYFGDGVHPAGVVQADWSELRSTAGAPNRFVALYVSPPTVCDAALADVDVDLSEVTYLGPVWHIYFRLF
jgi:hypothetical protein